MGIRVWAAEILRKAACSCGKPVTVLVRRFRRGGL